MSAGRYPSETSPLLCSSQSLQSYDAADDSSLPPSPTEYAPSSKASDSDLAWVLAGLWSAVFLGALDGECGEHVFRRSAHLPADDRDDRRYSAVPHRELLPRV